MFYLDTNAMLQGRDEDGMAVYAVEKPVKHEPRKAFSLDMEKLAKARADREAVAKLIGERA